jgi:hypothetical protein
MFAVCDGYQLATTQRKSFPQNRLFFMKPAGIFSRNQSGWKLSVERAGQGSGLSAEGSAAETKY